MTLGMRKLIVAGSGGAVFLLANALIVAHWLDKAGVVQFAGKLRSEFVTGTAITIIVVLLVLLVPAGSRILTYFDYGEYAIWHLAPRLRVSMDGRRETVYSAGTIAEHAAFYRDPVGRADYPDRLRADAVWVPNGASFDRALRPRGWTPVFEGPVSTVWIRAGGGPHVTRNLTAPRCFPGP